jgi:hypothetical protein
LEERVEDYQDDVDEMQDDLDTINNYENKIAALQDLEDDRLQQRQIGIRIDTYLEAGGVLEADDTAILKTMISIMAVQVEMSPWCNDRRKPLMRRHLQTTKSCRLHRRYLESRVSTIDDQIAAWQER